MDEDMQRDFAAIRNSPRIEHALRVVLKHEGGFTVDHAGPTNRGITLAALKDSGDLDFDIDKDGDLDEKDLRAMRVEEAMIYYLRHWWRRYEYDRILDLDVATKVFDLSVNMSSRQAHKLLQRAVRACGHPLVDDGIIGPLTLSAVNRTDAQRLLVALRSEAAGFYRLLAAKTPSKYGKYLKGWLARAYA